MPTHYLPHTMLRLTSVFALSATLAACGGGDSDNNSSTIPTPTNLAPTNVELLGVQAQTSTSADVRWLTAKDDKTAASQIQYEVHFSTDPSFTPSAATLRLSAKATDLNNDLHTVISGLAAATTYSVKLVAIDSEGIRTESAATTVTTPAAGITNTAPVLTDLIQTNVTVVDAGSINVAWQTAVDDSTPASQLRYEIFLSTRDGGSLRKFSGQGGTSATISGLESGTKYNVIVVAIDAQGLRTASNAISVTIPSGTVINQAPANVVLTQAQAVSASLANVAWVAASDDATPQNQLTYEIHASETSGFTPDGSTLKFSGKNILQRQITGLKPATTYYVRLAAIDEQGLKTVSDQMTATTLAATTVNKAPTAPGFTKAEVTGFYEAIVNWQAATDDKTPAEQLKYLVYAKEQEQIHDPVKSTVIGETSAKITLRAGTAYKVYVQTIDTEGKYSQTGNEVSVETPDTSSNQPPRAQILSLSADPSCNLCYQITWSAGVDDSTPADQLKYWCRISFSVGGGSISDYLPLPSTSTSAKFQLSRYDEIYTVNLIVEDAQGARGVGFSKQVNTPRAPIPK